MKKKIIIASLCTLFHGEDTAVILGEDNFLLAGTVGGLFGTVKILSANPICFVRVQIGVVHTLLQEQA